MLLRGKEALDIESKNCHSEVNELSYHYSLKTYIFLNISKLNLKFVFLNVNIIILHLLKSKNFKILTYRGFTVIS